MIKCYVTKKEQQATTRWSGGVTRQLAIYPPQAEGSLSLDFVFEVTSSTMGEATEYTIYESYNRTLMLLEGESRLDHEDGSVNFLGTYGQCSFDGALPTTSRGRGTDYELMLRKGDQGKLRCLNMTAKANSPGMRKVKASSEATCFYLGLYCNAGFLSVDVAGEDSFFLHEGDQFSLLVQGHDMAAVKFSGRGFVVETAAEFRI